MYQPYVLLGILMVTMVLFLWGFWRYDIVAFLALITSVLLGIVPFSDAFSGFSNFAVVTVGCMMIITHAISNSGIISIVSREFDFFSKSITLQISALMVTGLILSSFMNNVGALGLMMPIAIQTAFKHERSPSLVLMPLAFSTILGGVMTLIASPATLLVSHYRALATGHSYNMFDFTAVGSIISLAGILFASLLGWRLLPNRRSYKQAEELFQIPNYMTEVKIPKNSAFINKSVKEIEAMSEANIQLIAIIRRNKKIFHFSADELLKKSDTLIVAASSDDLEKLIYMGKLNLLSDKPVTSGTLVSEDRKLIEAVIPPDSDVEGKSSKSLHLNAYYSINLIAISREGCSFKKKLNEITFRAGDVVLLQGNVETIQDTIVNLGFLPLAERKLNVGIHHKDILLMLIFGMAILFAAFNILPVAISFATAVLALILFKVLPDKKSIFKSIDWSVLLLLAAMIPLGNAIQTTGTADLITKNILSLTASYSSVAILTLVLVLSSVLSNAMNFVAATVVMSPIAIQIAQNMHYNVDSFLMAVVIGTACSFLTPIAHQSNIMVLGPGGYRFFDFMRLGLPLQLIVMATSIPAILWIWPI